MDKPLEETAAIAQHQMDGGFTIWMKWTCPNCGSRQTMEEPNVLFSSGHCQECNTVSEITHCGLLAAKGAVVPILAQDLKEA